MMSKITSLTLANKNQLFLNDFHTAVEKSIQDQSSKGGVSGLTGFHHGMESYY